MAFVLTYQSLTTLIQDYLERQDARLVESIPIFLMLGQRRLCRDLKILNIKKFVTGNVVAGQPLLQKPGDWISTAYFNIGTGTGFNTKVILQLRTDEYCDAYAPDPTQTAQPKYFADYDFNTIKLVPTPDVAYPFEWGYYVQPPFLDQTQGTNILTTTIPDVLIYACLLETATYLKDDERVSVWTDYYTKSRDAINAEDMSRIQVGYNPQVH